jgi:hypothetical protein
MHSLFPVSVTRLELRQGLEHGCTWANYELPSNASNWRPGLSHNLRTRIQARSIQLVFTCRYSSRCVIVVS